MKIRFFLILVMSMIAISCFGTASSAGTRWITQEYGNSFSMPTCSCRHMGLLCIRSKPLDSRRCSLLVADSQEEAQRHRNQICKDKYRKPDLVWHYYKCVEARKANAMRRKYIALEAEAKNNCEHGYDMVRGWDPNYVCKDPPVSQNPGGGGTTIGGGTTSGGGAGSHLMNCPPEHCNDPNATWGVGCTLSGRSCPGGRSICGRTPGC